ncbi:MAG: hypothetical protein P9M14_18000 [Candidatus Alcyoniella australis]|nr:hypothetical protein [Candidatus Alcyoniella australis]
MEANETANPDVVDQRPLRSIERLCNIALLLGLLSFPFCCLFISGFPAVIISGLALERLRETPDVPRAYRRRAWTGMILGCLGIVVGLGLFIYYYINRGPILN